MSLRPWLLCILSLGPHPVAAQRPGPSFLGTVRQVGDSGSRLAGAEVLLGNRQTTTDQLGQFRLDNVEPGRYHVRVRRVGYHPIYSRVAIEATRPTEADFFMTPAPLLLPTLEVEGTRTGVYGVVGDTAFRPLAGARVAVLGYRGGDRLTDSLGRFAFPEADRGPYMVQVSYPGLAERRIVIEVPTGRGRELGFRLAPEIEPRTIPGSAEALWELRGRLAMGQRKARMAPSELSRFGTMRLCDVPKIRAEAGDPATVVLNGVEVLREVSLCSWRVDEIALIELCSMGPCINPDAPRPLRYPDPRGRQRRGGAIIIWEKR